MNTWWEYVVRTSGTTSPKEMAGRTGIDAPSFSKWKTGAVPKAETVAKFARAYGGQVLEGFVAANFLTPEEAGERPVGRPSLADYSDDQLLDELRRRFRDLSLQVHYKADDGPGGSVSAIRRRAVIEDAQPVRQAAGTSSQQPPEPEPESQDSGDMEPR